MDGDVVYVKVLRDYAQVQFSPFDGRWVTYRSKVVTYVVNCAEHKLGHLSWSLHARSKGLGRLVLADETGAVLSTRRPRELGDLSAPGAGAVQRHRTRTHHSLTSPHLPFQRKGRHHHPRGGLRAMIMRSPSITM
jgi:hypothetical protein